MIKDFRNLFHASLDRILTVFNQELRKSELAARIKFFTFAQVGDQNLELCFGVLHKKQGMSRIRLTDFCYNSRLSSVQPLQNSDTLTNFEEL
jgi:hypothetical protein